MCDNNVSEKVYELGAKLFDGCVTHVHGCGQEPGKVFFATMHRKGGAYGYTYVAENWKTGDVQSREIGLTPDALARGPMQMCETILHELVHAINQELRINDCNGATHNGRFKAMCDKIGLDCYDSGTYVKWHTDLEHTTEKCRVMMAKIIMSVWTADEIRFMAHLTEGATAYTGGSTGTGSTGGTFIPIGGRGRYIGGSSGKNLSVFICPKCGAKARAKESANLLCGNCSTSAELVKMLRK